MRTLKGPLYRDVNKELRQFATQIAKDLVPEVAAAVRRSNAPQAGALAKTVRAHSDRVPVVVVGKTNPYSGKAWKRKTTTPKSSKRRRGAMAHGVVYGPLGGRADTDARENYYRIPRDDSGGALGAALREGGPLWDEACEVYLKVYASVMRHHGFIGHQVKALHWNGRG